MNIGKACSIFGQIESDEYTEQEKLQAIKEVIAMPTHNGITKTEIIGAFKWFFDWAAEESDHKQTNTDRIRSMSDEELADMEGTDPLDDACYADNGWRPTLLDPDSGGSPNIIDGFQKLWNSTLKKSDLDRYGWDANPWVWVIEFERCEKPVDAK